MDINPLQLFISKLFETEDQIKAISTWRFSRQIGESYCYKNSLTRKTVMVDSKGNPKDFDGSELALQEAFKRQYKHYGTIMEYHSNLTWFEGYKDKKYEEKSVLKEGIRKVGKFVIPDTYDHLKWDLSDDQILELHRFVNYPIDTMTEYDIRNVSKTLGIPEKNLISIHNTYAPKDQKVRFVTEWDKWEEKRFPNTSKGLVVTAKDAGLTTDNMNKPPKFGNGGKSIRNYETPAEQRYNKSNFKLQRTSTTPDQIQEYPRMDEFLMMYLEVDYKPLALEMSTTKKIIMSLNPEEVDHEVYENIGNSLDEFNGVYGTGYVLAGTYVKEGEEKLIIDVDQRNLSKSPSGDALPPVEGYEERQALKHKAVQSMLDNYHDRIHGTGHWDKDKGKMMRQFMSGEMGYIDSSKVHSFG